MELLTAPASPKPLYKPHTEQILAARPTVILTQGLCPVCAATPATIKKYWGNDYEMPKLIVLAPQTLDDVRTDILTVGEAVGQLGNARVVAKDFERRLEKVRERGRPS